MSKKPGGAPRHHLIVRADVLRPPTEGEARDWFFRLIPAVGMEWAEIPSNPLVYYCTAPGNRGLTATAIIETSNITLHTWDEQSPAELQLDVFTCGDLDADTVLRFVGEFDVVGADYWLLDRRGGLFGSPFAAKCRVLYA